MNALRRLALATAIGTYILIVVGAIVRSTGSGLGCPDWPLCHGGFVPPPQVTAWIEFSHRFTGAAVSTLMLALLAAAWVWGRQVRHILIPATAVPLLLAAQITLGAWVVWLETPSLVVMVHFSFALVILAFVLWVNVSARAASGSDLVPVLSNRDPALLDAARRRLAGFWALAIGAMLVTFGQMVVGGLTRALGAGWVCVGWPGCNGQALPFGASPSIDLQLTHRLMAYLVTALMVWIAVWASRMPFLPAAIKRVGLTLVVVVLAQAAIGIVAVLGGPGWFIQTLHVAGATAVWTMVVVLVSMVWQTRRLFAAPIVSEDAQTDALGAPAGATATVTSGQIATAYLMLTKPRVMVLLLITTLAAMLMAHRGLPPLGLIFITLLGGGLAAGGAGAINHYLDRDIDVKMGRTVTRPIPAGLIPPLNALFFGICLGIISFTLMVAFVNTLSAVLTLFALLFYVFIYTRWLKRWTPLNIVIGGAAGAIPPVVGIAAVTNEVNWLAIWLFAIIFIWTPPHFWALSLLMQREYAAAGVPMLPIVRGEEETRKQILWYSLAMVALTVAVWTLGLLGVVYIVSAGLLGSVFIYYAVRLWREASAMAARRLFRYSILYLALLFVAMVVDRQVLL
jgi:protoheme IX farnesyltransferase